MAAPASAQTHTARRVYANRTVVLLCVCVCERAQVIRVVDREQLESLTENIPGVGKLRKLHVPHIYHVMSNSSDTVQTPSLTLPSVPFSLPPDVGDQAGLFESGRFSWSTSHGSVYITDTNSGQCVQSWLSHDYEITHVCELEFTGRVQRSLLVIALEGDGHHVLGVLSSLGVKLIRSILIPDTITCIHPFSYKGFPPPQKDMERFSRPDMFPESVLSLYNGIVAVGTHKGHIYLVDLQLGEEVPFERRCSLNSPSELHIIEGPVSGDNIKVISESSHVTVELSRENFHKGMFIYQKSSLSPASLSATAILFAPQITSLFVGYSFGGFQMYDLSTFQLLHSSPLITLPSVTHFTYVEPENDPRMFVYVWIVRGKSRFVREGSLRETKASLQQMIFLEKTSNANGHTLYRGFQRCGVRLEYAFTPTPNLPNPLLSPDSNVIQCSTLVRYHNQQGSHLDMGHDIDLSTAVFVWSVGSGHSSDIIIGLFDTNQWYQAQMPTAVRWKKSVKYTGVLGCSYFSFYSLKQVVMGAGRVMDVVVDGFLPFHSHPPMPEIFMWPSASRFRVKCLSSTSVESCEFLGLQRMALHDLDVRRGSLYTQPERLFQACANAELLPPSWDHDHTSITDISYQKTALLDVVVNYGCPTRILTAFADGWAGAGGDDPVIIKWVGLKKAELVRLKESICESVFACCTPLISPSTHLRKMAAMNIFLERLVSHTSKQEETTAGSVYEEVTDLYCTVALHMKIMEVLVFLNEKGLVSDYPAAALKRRYDMLRGSEEQGKLAVDYLVEDLHGNSNECPPVYPPPSLSSFMDIFMRPNAHHQHCLLMYLLCDIGSLRDDGPFSLSAAYSCTQDIPHSVLTTIQGIWILDNRKYKDPAYKQQTALLFRKRDSSVPLFPWQHSVITNSLLVGGEVRLALNYLHLFGEEMHATEEVKLKFSVLVSNSLVSEAYKILRQFEGTESYDELFEFFLDCCIEAKSLHLLLTLPLSGQAEMVFVTSLEQHATLACRELLVFYFITRHRIVEALAMHERIRPFAKSDPDPLAMQRCSQREIILAGLQDVVPNNLHNVQLTREGQRPKVKVDVNKSLSSVFAKTMKSNHVPQGGIVYSLIQSIAEKRSASGDPYTPFRHGKDSITELSVAPFLSTPVSVRKVRAHPLTAQRSCRLVTPTPRPHPPTPPIASLTHQRHIQSFKDRMAWLGQSGVTSLDVSTPVHSPVTSAPLPKPSLPVAPPQSILKRKTVESKLTADRRIRFSMEGTPMVTDPGVRKLPQTFTPAVLSSLSYDNAIATTSPLSSSEDSDIFESPMESPSQLRTPITNSPDINSKTSTPQLPPTATKLQFPDVEDENSPQRGACDVPFEGEDEVDAATSSVVVKGSQAVFGEGEIEPSEEMAEQPVEPSPLNVSMGKPTSELITSSVSLKITPVSKTDKSYAVSSSTASSPFFPSSTASSPFFPSSTASSPLFPSFTASSPFVSKTATPSLFSSSVATVPGVTKPSSSQLFSPVPYLSDLLQAKKDKLHRNYEAQKQRDVSALKIAVSKCQSDSSAPPPTVPVTTRQSSQKVSTNLSNFSASMAQSATTLVATPTNNSAYSFTPPKQVLCDAHPQAVLVKSDAVSFAFSPPLTRSAAQRHRRESESREMSVEPTSPHTQRRHGRGRPCKTTLPATDDSVLLVTPSTSASSHEGATRKQQRKPKSLKPGAASRRSARLLTGKK